MFLSFILNKWLFTFYIAWVLFFLLVDWRSFPKNIWGGIIAIIIQLLQDSFAHFFGVYVIHNPGIYLLKSSIFFTFGLVFTVGILFQQFLPRHPTLQFLHILIFAAGLTIFEFVLIQSRLIEHFHWGYAGSFFDNIMVMASLAWLKFFVLHYSNQRGES